MTEKNLRIKWMYAIWFAFVLLLVYVAVRWHIFPSYLTVFLIIAPLSTLVYDHLFSKRDLEEFRQTNIEAIKRVEQPATSLSTVLLAIGAVIVSGFVALALFGVYELMNVK